MPASDVIPNFKSGDLHSGSKTGPKVTDPKQAKAILLSEARGEGYNIPLPPKKRMSKPRGTKQTLKQGGGKLG